MTSAAPSRLSRLLAMVPYFEARPGIKLAEAAKDLGVNEKTLTADLNQLIVCGLPGYGPEHLIDIQFWDGYVSVQYAAGTDRPLRLTGSEAGILLMALNMVLQTRGSADAGAVRSTIAKIEEAMGATYRAVTTGADADDRTSPADRLIREAVESRRALRMKYYTASRDEVTDRVVDPIRIKAVDGHTYLEAWCRSSEGTRLFRFDRVEAAAVLDEPSVPPADATVPVEAVDFGVLTGELPAAHIEIDPDSIWLLEYYAAEPDEELTDEPTGPITATLRYGSPQWLARFLLGFGGRVRLLSTVDGVGELIAHSARSARDRYSA
ncbi:helix-turn-helix transcriptional regulator [Gordonia hydrophobica]|uniref:WYL domain-containing protein n=1 Tax=Gordonia hydrophobica TaxID=40516 RepID=A0ABZ2U029_9ACTN|nr:WYL domain-containing protein [Gordonia hydrophobica]MBM7369369.1 proteasome accessory factor C [Gordonia hydrophobica]